MKQHLAALVTSLCLAAVSLTAVPARGEPSKIFGEQIEVRVVNLAVVVEDRKGNRVTGLGAQDFRLRVDGREVSVGYFSEIVEGRRAPEIGGQEEPVPSATDVQPGEAVGTSYLVYIDDYFSGIIPRDRILRRMIRDLPRLAPEDRMAIVAFNGRRLRMLSNWSQSQDELRSAFEQAMQLRTRGEELDFQVASAEQDAVLRSEMDAEIAGEDSASGQRNQSAEERLISAGGAGDFHFLCKVFKRRLEKVTMSATATLRSFAQPPGRRVMLLLSGGWPLIVEDYLAGATSDLKCSRQGPEIYEPIYDTANLLGYTLYPIDVPGPEGPPISITGFGIPQPGRSPGASVRESELETTLHRIADKTGGRALIDGQTLAAFDKVVADTRSYYWLGFSPQWRGDGRRHEIDLEVLRPGLEVRHREGYKDLSRAAEVSFMTESALLFGELPGAAPLYVELGPIPKGGKRKVQVPLEIRIPMDEVTMLPYQDGYVAELELRIAVLDKHGYRNDIPVIPVTLSGDAPPPAGQFAVYETSIKIRRQKQDVVVTIHDPPSDRILTAVTRLEP